MIRPKFFFLLAAIVLAGCTAEQHEIADQTETVNLFKKGDGVLLSGQTRELFGVELIEVAEKTFPGRMVKTAQVYRPAREDAPAEAVLLLSEDECKKLQPGQSVALKPMLGPELNGKLIRLDTHAQSVSGQTEALVEFADIERRVVAGAVLTATLTNKETRAGIAIPQSALLTAAEGHFVYAANGSHLTRTRVKPGATSDGFVEIQEGLYPGDSVAAKGLESLWLVELSALKGGKPCCSVPKKGK